MLHAGFKTDMTSHRRILTLWIFPSNFLPLHNLGLFPDKVPILQCRYMLLRVLQLLCLFVLALMLSAIFRLSIWPYNYLLLPIWTGSSRQLSKNEFKFTLIYLYSPPFHSIYTGHSPSHPSNLEVCIKPKLMYSGCGMSTSVIPLRTSSAS